MAGPAERLRRGEQGPGWPMSALPGRRWPAVPASSTTRCSPAPERSLANGLAAARPTSVPAPALSRAPMPARSPSPVYAGIVLARPYPLAGVHPPAPRRRLTGREARSDPGGRRGHPPAPLHDRAAQAADADRRPPGARHRRAPAQGPRVRADHDRDRVPGRADRGVLPRRREIRDPDRLLPRARAARHRRSASR